MEQLRIISIVGLMMVSVLLYQEWQSMYGPQPVQPPVATDVANSANVPTTDDLPAATPSVPSDAPVAIAQSSASVITLENDVLRIEVDLKGGDIVNSELLKFPVEQDGDEPMAIIHRNHHFEYVAQSGLIGNDGPDSKGRPQYTAEADSFKMSDGPLVVNLRHLTDSGVVVVKRYTLNPDSYVIQQELEVINGSSNSLVMQPFMQLKQTIEGESGSMMMPTYRGPAFSTEEERYSKYKFDELVDKPLNKTTQGGWVAMLQHYFVSAWVPDPSTSSQIYTNSVRGSGIIGMKGEQLVIPAGATETVRSSLFIGPKDQERLSALTETLNLTVDYGFLWWLALPLHWLLTMIQGLVVNWGVAIILVTVVIKSFLYPLTKKQYESMGRMRVLQPKMKALQERYAEDKQKLQQAMMELYRKEKVNPLGGCLPLLLQMPIFIALYWVLLESVELRHAGFALWITDLSVKDPYYVLPILMGASMFLMQKLSPTTITDPMQQKIMMFMPVMMTFLFVTFPSGLVLYWVVSNCISIVQQLMINRAIEAKNAASAA